MAKRVNFDQKFEVLKTLDLFKENNLLPWSNKVWKIAGKTLNLSHNTVYEDVRQNRGNLRTRLQEYICVSKRLSNIQNLSEKSNEPNLFKTKDDNTSGSNESFNKESSSSEYNDCLKDINPPNVDKEISVNNISEDNMKRLRIMRSDSNYKKFFHFFGGTPFFYNVLEYRANFSL